ncbi:DUF748 domain-containing protein [Desulfovibrio sp. OttesenSCG-928-O18]|nr:DUF748 domain-containing protein [Desulfovibrio sp. OttesenSCG-928-O18]
MSDNDTRKKTGFRPLSLVLTRRRRPGLFLWLAALFGLYCLVLGLVLPFFAKSVLEHELSQELGVVCSIGQLTVHPLTWEIIAFDVAVPYPETQQGTQGKDFIRLKRLEISLSPASAKNMVLIADALHLVEPHINIVRYKDGSLSPQFLFGGTGTNTKTEGENPSPDDLDFDLFPVSLSNITLTKGTLVVHDTVHDATFTATDIALTLPFASTLAADREKTLTPNLSAMVNGNRIAITGKTQPFAARPRTVFTLRTRDVGLAEFKAYAEPYTNLTLESGSLHTELTLRFDAEPDKALEFSVAGKAEVTDLALAGPGGTVFKTPRAGIEVENVLLGPRLVTVNDFFVENPEAVIRRKKNGDIDWAGFFFLPAHAPRSDVQLATGERTPLRTTPQGASGGTEPGMPLLLNVGKARVTGGKLTWHDATLKTPAMCTVENVALTFTDISTEKEGRAAFTASFGKGKQSFSATGKLTASPLRIDADVSLKEMPLAPFSGYLTEGQGVTLRGGTLGAGGSVSLQYGTKKTVSVTGGGVTISNVQIRDAKQTATPLLDLQRVEASSVSMDLAGQTLRVGKLTGTGISANLVRGKDGSLILPAPEAKAPTKTATPKGKNAPTAPWKIAVDALSVQKSRVSLVDSSLKTPAALPLADVSVSGGNFANHDKKQWNVTVSGKPGERGTLSLSAKGTLAPLNLTFSGKMDKADLQPLSPYIQEVSRITLSEATLGGDFSGTLKRVANTPRGADLGVNANLGLYGITMVYNGRELGGWGRMRLEKLAYRAPAKGGRHLSIGSVTVNTPRLMVDFDENGVSSITKALLPPGTETPVKTAAPAASAKKEPPLTSLSVGSVELSQGQAIYVDRRVAPPYSLRVHNVTASMKNVSLDPQKQAAVSGSLLINGSPVKVNGTLSALFSSPQGKGTVTIRSLDLSRFSQYGEKYLAYPVRRGEMNADIKASLKGKKLSMQNKITIRNLDLGPKVASAHAPDLPLPATATILRDKNGDIHLDLPVSGTLGDPEFKLGGMVRQVIGNLAVKTVTAPFSLIGSIFTGIGNLFGSSGPQSAEIVFAMGKSTLDKQAMESLQAVGRELKKQRSASLEITGMADRGERDVLVDAWVDQALKRLKYQSLSPAEKAKTSPDKVLVSPQYNAKEYADLLFALYKQMHPKESAPPNSTRAIMRILRQKAAIGDKELAHLAEVRAKAVYSAITRGAPDTAKRIRILPPVLSDNEKTGDRIASYARLRVVR